MTKIIKKIFSSITFMIITAIMTGGCSATDYEISLSNKKIMEWEVNEKDATQIINQNIAYQILKDKVEEDKIGELVGRIGKIITIDENQQIKDQNELNAANLLDLGLNSGDKLSYNIPFQNVYVIDNEEISMLVAIDINGSYYEAVPVNKKNQEKVAIDFEDFHLNFEDDFILDPDNYNQLISGDKTYVVTEELVDIKKLDILLDSINRTETIDVETGRKLNKEEMQKFEVIPSELTSQERRFTEFGDIYSIKDKSKNDLIAIKINEEYRVAKAIN